MGSSTYNFYTANADIPANGVRLKLNDGKELPVRVKPRYDWSKPVKGEDYVPYPPSIEKTPSDISFKPLYGYESLENPTLFGTDAYSTETVNGNFVQFDLGVPEVLNPVSVFLDYVWAGDFSSTDLNYTYAVNEATDEFIRIYKASGAIMVIGPCAPTQNPSGGEEFTGMAVDPTTGVVYLASTDLTTSWLYTVNISTGTPSLVDTITNSPGIIAIAINNNGLMYGHDIINDVTDDMENYRLHLAAEKLYHFAWHRIADLYPQSAATVRGWSWQPT